MRNKKLSCSGWLQDRSPLEKTLLSFSFLLLLTVILLIVLGISFRGTQDEEQTLCLSNECIETASQILSKMEDNWNPCSNFYEYSCGGLNRSLGLTLSNKRGMHSFLKNLLETSTDKRIASAKSIYKRCVEFSGLQESGKKPDDALRELMSKFEVGTWPVVDTFFDQDSQLTLDERLAGLSLLGIPLAYRMDVSRGSLKLSPGGPQMAGKSAEEIRDDMKLRTYLLSSFHLLGAPYSRAIADADDIISVDMWYANIEQSEESPCDTVSYIPSQESVKELKRLIPEYDWEVLIKAVERTVGSNTTFAVELHCKEKIRDYIVYLKDLSERSAYNYVGWRFYSAFEKHIIPEFSHLKSAKSLRWMDCIALIEQYASQSLTEALARHYIPQSTIQEVERMAEDIDSTIQRHFPLKTTSKLVAELKESLNRIKELFDSRAIKRTLPQVDVNNYTSVIVDLRRQSVAKELQKLRSPSVEEEDSTLSRNLLLTLLASEGIHISKVSKWFSYSTLGTALSRELYKEYILERCAEKSTDFCSSTAPYIRKLGANPTPAFTQAKEENLMKEVFFDVCSVEMAYDSFKQSRLPEEELLPGITRNRFQMFFIVYAQTFCEGDMKEPQNHKIRLNSFALKSSAFQEAFHCDSSLETPFECSTLVP